MKAATELDIKLNDRTNAVKIKYLFEKTNPLFSVVIRM